MRFWLTALFACLMLSCTTTPAADGFPIIKAPVAGETLSCKGTQCCWPWTNSSKHVIFCLKPIEGGPYGAAGILIIIRGPAP